MGFDGICYLLMFLMVECAVLNCLCKGEFNDGEIEGC